MTIEKEPCEKWCTLDPGHDGQCAWSTEQPSPRPPGPSEPMVTVYLPDALAAGTYKIRSVGANEYIAEGYPAGGTVVPPRLPVTPPARAAHPTDAEYQLVLTDLLRYRLLNPVVREHLEGYLAALAEMPTPTSSVAPKKPGPCTHAGHQNCTMRLVGDHWHTTHHPKEIHR